MGKARRPAVLALSATLAFGSCVLRPPPVAPPDPVFVIESLGRSIEPLRAAFNTDRERARLVVLLSPSCPRSEFALQTLRQAIVESFAEEDFRVFIVWTGLLPTDDYDAARRVSLDLADERVRLFYDGQRRAGRTFARGLLPVSAARDTYLFYAPGQDWAEDPPEPLHWSHQLGRVELDHFYSNDELYVQLNRSMRSLLDH